MLVEGIGRDLDLDPFAATGDDREYRGGGVGDPHVVLDLGHMLLSGRLLRERPGKHEFRLKDRTRPLHDAVQRGGHPADHGMPNPGLDVLDDLSGRFLVPASVEGLSGGPKLDDEVIRVIWWFRLAALLSPQAYKGGLVGAHDDPCIRASDKASAVGVFGVNRRWGEREGHDTLQFSCTRISAAALRITPSASNC